MSPCRERAAGGVGEGGESREVERLAAHAAVDTTRGKDPLPRLRRRRETRRQRLHGVAQHLPTLIEGGAHQRAQKGRIVDGHARGEAQAHADHLRGDLRARIERRRRNTEAADRLGIELEQQRRRTIGAGPGTREQAIRHLALQHDREIGEDRPLIEASVRNAIVTVLKEIGRSDLALPHAERALSLRRRVLGDDPSGQHGRSKPAGAHIRQ